MPDFRCHCAYDPAHSEHLLLSPEESHHLVAANRARVGAPVQAFDGNGREWDAVLQEADKRGAVLRIERERHIKPPAYTLALAQALPKGKLIESIIRKATEIGIQRVHPLQSERVESRFDAKREQTKNAKWQAATIEGAKQSGNPFLLEIEPLTPFSTFLAGPAVRYELRLIASLTHGTASVRQHLQNFVGAHGGKQPRSVVWLIGPEGDFSEQETEAALKAGFLPTSLGPFVMRCETAAVSAMSVLRHELAL